MLNRPVILILFFLGIIQPVYSGYMCQCPKPNEDAACSGKCKGRVGGTLIIENIQIGGPVSPEKTNVELDAQKKFQSRVIELLQRVGRTQFLLDGQSLTQESIDQTRSLIQEKLKTLDLIEQELEQEASQ